LELLQGSVPVNKTQQDLKKFDCGKPVMNEFLARRATRERGLGISTTWVLLCDEAPLSPKAKVAAYYTLCSGRVSREDVPLEKSHPPYDLPVVLLAKLAIDKQFQGLGLGEKTLIEALRQAASLTRPERGLQAIGLVLDVLDEDALAFYGKFEAFKPFTDNPMRLFMPMNVVRQI
jgi:GNAT superfamily N-acetyltransferase